MIRTRTSKSSLTAEGNSNGDSLDSSKRLSIRPSPQILIEKGNPRCCDCNSPDPQWASINLGITLCIECSGIHRSLGVQVSKVRSLFLDDWEPTWIKILTLIGNDACNEVYQSINDSGRIASDSSRDAREKWIKAKYVCKKFVELTPEHLEQTIDSNLQDISPPGNPL